MEPEAGGPCVEHQLSNSAVQDQGGRSTSQKNQCEAGETKLKNLTEPKYGIRDPEQLDARELKRRATEDAVKDADSYAVSARPQRKKDSVVQGLDPISYLMKAKQPQVTAGSQEGIDGLLIHANDSQPNLVLSDEMLEISLADEVAALEDQPIKIFHVQSPAPWVEQVFAGKA